MEFLLGIVCGVALSLFFSFGPAFFSQLQTSIHYGFSRSVPFAFGVSASDVVMVFLMLTVLRDVSMFDILHNVYVASAAGVVLALMGVYTYRKKACEKPHSPAIKFHNEDEPRRLTVFLRGFVTNIINPLLWLYWVSVIALLSGELNIPTNHLYLFFFGVLLATLSLDILKCKLASMLHRIVTPRVINIFNKCVGVILILFAIYLVASMLRYQLDPTSCQHENDTSIEMIKKVNQGMNQGIHPVR